MPELERFFGTIGGFLGKILIVDDEKDVSDILTATLEKDGHTVIAVGSGEQALELVKTNPPDLIILDVLMPGMDGYTVHARLSERAATRSIPVIMLTVRAKMRDLFEVSSNVVGFIEKPFDPKSLCGKIREVLTKKQPS
jgi:CheY-like chemotaxis protein